MKLPYLSNEYHYAITRLAVYAAELDHVVELVVDRHLQNKQETARFLVKNTATDRMVELARSLLVDAYPDQTESTDSLFADIRAGRTERNNILHSLIDDRVNIEGAISFVRDRPHREVSSIERSPEQITKAADSLRRCSDALLDFARKARP